jgi:anti-sigma factor RsiW
MNVPSFDERTSLYLDGDMAVAERIAFEAELRRNPELRAQVRRLEDGLGLLRAAFQEEPPPLRLTLKAMALVSPRSWASPFIASALPRMAARVRGYQSRRSYRRVGSFFILLSLPRP